MKEFTNEDPELAWFVGVVEGEGSFCVCKPRPGRSYGEASFSIQMTDKDVILGVQEITSNWGVKLNLYGRQGHRYAGGVRISTNVNGEPYKYSWTLQSHKGSALKIIIDKTYPYYSEKKQSDCDRVLKNLADRGLL